MCLTVLMGASHIKMSVSTLRPKRRFMLRRKSIDIEQDKGWTKGASLSIITIDDIRSGLELLL